MEIRTTRIAPKSLPSSVYVRSSTGQCGSKKVGERYPVAMADALKKIFSADGEGGIGDPLSLPRVQVTVNVAQQQLQEFDSASDLVDSALPNVLQKLEEIATSASGVSNRCSTRSTHMEEGAYHLELKPDMSLRVAQPTTTKKNVLSPEKTGSSYANLKRLQPSPVRKLVLGSTAESEEEESDEAEDEEGGIGRRRGQSNNWKVIGVTNLSVMNVMCVIDASTRKMVLNVVFNVLERLHPASPTTGLRMPPSNALLAQMDLAKSGFALLALEGGLLSIGGFTRERVLDVTEFYDIRYNCWDNRGDLNTKRARFAAVECGGSPYIIGGSDGKNELGSIEVYSTKSHTWEKTATRMVTPRSCFDAATLNGKIYAVGGVYYSIPLKSAEVYDPHLQKWKLIPAMQTSRCGLSVAASCGKVYVIGGQTCGWKCLATVECYDPKTTTWSKVASMKTPRRNAVSVAVDGKIYIIGGYNGSSAVNLVEVYDPKENAWRCLPPMRAKRSSASAVHLNGSIFVAGGYCGSSFLNSVERYDIKKNQWSSYT